VQTSKPRVQGIETGTVVGPVGEEIHCDEFGRVRVSFPWDRESGMDEQSSCWIPISQAHAGARHGVFHLPRIGQEVLVDFLNGDPDRPVIVGRVHTALQQVPYRLPDNKTQSAWRSESSPGGGGYNEILFEDKKGAELIRTHAERDMATTVERDVLMTIERDAITTVRRDEKRKVERDAETIVARNATQLVQDHVRQSCGLSSTRCVGVNDVVDVGGDQMHTVAGNHSLDIGGQSATTIAGSYSLHSGATMNVTADGTICIASGAASITLEPAGTITLAGTKIVLASSGPITAIGTKIGVSGTTIGIVASGAAEMGGASLHLVGDPVTGN
jgi:type VI secretion system secreted protein VgrG